MKAFGRTEQNVLSKIRGTKCPGYCRLGAFSSHSTKLCMTFLIFVRFGMSLSEDWNTGWRADCNELELARNWSIPRCFYMSHLKLELITQYIFHEKNHRGTCRCSWNALMLLGTSSHLYNLKSSWARPLSVVYVWNSIELQELFAQAFVVFIHRVSLPLLTREPSYRVYF